METLKVIFYVLLAEVIIYYLFSCFHKWYSASYYETKDIFNPFKSWREAERQQYWYEGYEAYKASIKDELEAIDKTRKDFNRLSEETKIVTEETKKLSEQVDQLKQSKETERRISAN